MHSFRCCDKRAVQVTYEVRGLKCNTKHTVVRYILSYGQIILIDTTWEYPRIYTFKRKIMRIIPKRYTNKIDCSLAHASPTKQAINNEGNPYSFSFDLLHTAQFICKYSIGIVATGWMLLNIILNRCTWHSYSPTHREQTVSHKLSVGRGHGILITQWNRARCVHFAVFKYQISKLIYVNRVRRTHIIKISI